MICCNNVFFCPHLLVVYAELFHRWFCFSSACLNQFWVHCNFVLFFESNTSRPSGDSTIQESENIFSLWF